MSVDQVLVPAIDLSGWGTGDDHAIAAAVDRALRDVGFMQVTGHGIPDVLIERALSASDTFFALPLDTKLQYLPPAPEVNRGYASIGSESLTYSLGREADASRSGVHGGAAPVGDLFEAFNIGPTSHPDDEFHRALAGTMFHPNLWPQEVPELELALGEYFAAARRTADLLTDVFALALGLPAGWFRQFTGRSTETMRTIRYHRQPGEPEPVDGQQRMGAHTDYGIVTVLYADEVPGLEIVGPDGAWHPVQPAPGAVLVNLGDLTAQWTNDRWRSTVHRVVPPPRHVEGPAIRRSMAYFLDGDDDAHVECLPTCTDASNPPRYPPVTAGDHLRAKLLGPRTATPSAAVSTLGDRLSTP